MTAGGLSIPHRRAAAGLPAAWYAAVVLVAGALGAVAAVSPLLAVGAAAGLALTASLFVDLAVGLCMFVVVAHLEALPKLVGAVSLAKVTGLLLTVSWLLALTIRRRHRGWNGPRPLELTLLLAFLAWVTASLLWADDLPAALDASSRFALNLALFPIVAVAIRRPGEAVGVFAALVAGAMISAIYGVVFGTGADDDRLGGAGVNPNALGLVAIIGSVLGWTLALVRSHPFPARLLAAGAGSFCMLVLLLTVSRGALVGFGAALLGALMFAGRGRRGKAVPVAVVGAACVVVYFAFLAPPEARMRVTTPGDGSGRTEVWQVGLRVAEANPVMGLGAGNFRSQAVRYVVQPGLLLRSDTVVDKPKVPHNIYLQVLTELGLIGLVMFLGILAIALGSAVGAARRFARMGELRLELLSRGLSAAVVGLLVAGFFSSQLFSKPLWLTLAMCPAMLGLARSRAAAGAGAPAP